MRKHLLLAGTAAFAVALAAPAHAFDTVDWEWNKTITENITKNWVIGNTLVPSGMVEVQKFQFHVGNVESTALVSGVTNNQPSEGESSGPVDVTLSGLVNENTIIDDQDGEIARADDDEGNGGIVVTTADGVDTGTLVAGFENTDGLESSDWSLSFEVSPEAITGRVLDATTELPTIENAATSVANNQNIESAVSVQLHDGQYAFGDFTGSDGSETPQLSSVDGMGSVAAGSVFDSLSGDIANTQLSAALTLAVAGNFGLISAAEVTSTARVSDIENARVENAATSVANNMNVEVNPVSTADRLVIADITQFGYANVSSTAAVRDVTLSNYENLGARGVNPIVSNTATSVGNNLNISVNGD